MSESLRVGLLLATSGGYMDAYTFVTRGGVFSNAETGNMVRLGMCLAQRSWSEALDFAFPILAFACGVLSANLVQLHCRQIRPAWRWRQLVLVLECIVLGLVSLLPMGPLDALANVMVAFVSAVQMQTFRTFHGNPGGTTMCTGNLRSGTEQLFRFLSGRDAANLRNAMSYYAIILCFITGALIGSLLVPPMGQYGILPCCVLILLVFTLMFFDPKE